MSEKFVPGELFVYVNGDRWELGKVKRPNKTGGYFCWYHSGDTAASTPTNCMYKLANAGFTHIEQELREAKLKSYERTATCHVVHHGATGHCECSACGLAIDPWDKFCRHCGASMKEGW